MLPISKRFREALDYTAALHADHARKGGDVPYLSHLLGVAALAMQYGASEDEAIAALLHDAVEDQGGLPTLLAIRERFGDEVARIVDACSDTDQIPKPPWRHRKEAYLRHLESTDDSVRLVSTCDKIHNLQTILSDFYEVGRKIFERFNAGELETLWYYDELSKVFSRLGPARPAADLARTLDSLKRELQR